MNVLRNRVQLIGYIGADPEMKTTDQGKKFVRLRLATHEGYKNAGGDYVAHTQWHNIVAWEKAAELLSNKLHKGSEVMVEGKLQYNEYTDKEGIKRYTTDIVLSEFLVFERK